MSSSSLLRLCLCAVLLLQLLGWATAQAVPTLPVGTNYGFETPRVSGGYGFWFTGSFANPFGAPGNNKYTPFAFSENAGIAEVGSAETPLCGTAAAGRQFAFMQPNGGQSLTATIAAAVSGLTSARDYQLSFSFSTRALWPLQDLSVTVTLGDMTVAHLDLFNSSVVDGRWHSTCFYFIWRQVHSGLPMLTFTVVSPGANQMLTLDQIRIKPATS